MMEPASVLAKVALGLAALIPTAQIQKKPIELYVHLAQWDNKVGKPVEFEHREELRNTIADSGAHLFTLPPGITQIDQKLLPQTPTDNFPFKNNILRRTSIRLQEKENADYDVRLRLIRFVDEVRDNYLRFELSRHIHTRQITASCPLYRYKSEWNPDEPIQSIHFIISGSVSGEYMVASQLTVKEIRCARLLSLLELTLAVIDTMVHQGKIDRNLIPQDLHTKLEDIHFIKCQAPANPALAVPHF